jgi:hypothetical protein
MAPLWFRLVIAGLALAVWAGMALVLLLRTRDVQAYIVEKMRNRAPHPIFGRSSPDHIFHNIIFTGVVAALGALGLIYAILGMLLGTLGIDIRIRW